MELLILSFVAGLIAGLILGSLGAWRFLLFRADYLRYKTYYQHYFPHRQKGE